jgi:hypothetical protein
MPVLATPRGRLLLASLGGAGSAISPHALSDENNQPLTDENNQIITDEAGS